MRFSLPLEIKIELTERCNYRCGFCFNASRKKSSRQLSENNLKKIVARVAAEGIQRIRFTGGEPLLRKDLLSILSFAKKQGLHVMLNTNGSLIDEGNAAKLSKLVDNFLISMHAFDAAGERRLSGKNFFDKKAKAVKLLAAHNSFIRAATILTKQNIKNLLKMHRLVAALPFNQWVLLRPMPNQEDLHPINSQDIKQAVEKLLQINKGSKEGERFFVENALPFCSYEPHKVQRVALGAVNEDGNNSLVVDSSGKVKPSYFFATELGSALQDSFIECWHSSFMQQLHSLDFAPSACKSCRYLMQCMGGSRFCALLENKSQHALDPLAKPFFFQKKL